MSVEINQDSIGQLFCTVLQHMKCIEVRIDVAKSLTSQKHKYALGNAVNKIRVAIDHIAGLLQDSDMVMKLKKELDRPDLVYVMLFTEQLMQAIHPDDMEEVVDLLQNYIDKKYPK